MKNLFLTLTALLFAFGSYATIITVSNNPDNPGQYDDLQDAHDAASAGDTIYLHGSKTPYGSVDVTKKITLIGTGYLPDNQWDLKSTVSTIKLTKNSTGLQDASGTKIIGLNYSSITNGATSGNKITGIRIYRCKGGSINLSQYCSSWIIRNNVIEGSISVSSASHVTIRNNLFFGNGRVQSSNKSTVLVTNNVFHRNSGTAISSCDYLTFTNNILINCDVGSTSSYAEYCTFNNNITTENSSFVYGTNTGGGNMAQTDPELEDISNGVSSSGPFVNNYTLQYTSPAIGAGTDSTDIGITGGQSPFTVHDMLQPAIPQILEMNIQNANISLGDTLHIQIKARKQD